MSKKEMSKFFLLSFSIIVLGLFFLFGQTDPSSNWIGHRFFPAPAYSIVLLVAPRLWLHLLLVGAGVFIWLETFKIKVSWYHYVLVIPYCATQAYGSPASIPSFLFIVTIYLMRKRIRWWGIIGGASYLFRTEMLFLGLFKNWILRLALIIFALGYFVMFGNIFTTNSPAVFYLSLGQLPNNSWHIQYSDSVSNVIARKSGYSSAWDAPEMFTELSIKAIKADPVEYARKCLYNLFMEFRCGFYSGVDETLLHYPTAIIFGLLFCYSLLWAIFHIGREDDSIKFIVFTFLFLIVSQSLGQQLSRHFSVVYLPMMGMIFEKSIKSK